MSHRSASAILAVSVVVCALTLFAGLAVAGERIVVSGVRPRMPVTVVSQEKTLAPEAGIVLTAQPCSESEPNEEPSQADVLSIPSQCSGSVSSTDLSSLNVNYESGPDGIEDVYVLTLPTRAQPTIELSYSGATADLDLFLFTYASGKVEYIDYANHDSDGAAERIQLSNPLAAGTYYVGISAFHGSSPYALSVSAPGYSETCTPAATTVCLNKGRFRVETEWQTNDGKSGQGRAVLLTPDTGYFWFFDETNVEVILKTLDACSYNSRFWIFAAGMTDVHVKLRVTDTVTGVTKEYTNPVGTAYKPVTDTGAFATCTTSCAYSVSPTTQQMSASGGTGTISVSAGSGCAWTATSDVSWITITGGSSGTGSGSVSYLVGANTAMSARTGTMTVAGNTVTIQQAAATATCTYGVSPTSQQLDSPAANASVSVTAPLGCTWTATSNASWITITAGASGSGTGTVSYSVTANSDTASRSGTLTVATKTVTVTQAGNTAACTYSLDYTSKAFGWCGGDTTVRVTTQTGCTWSVASSAPWLTSILASSKSSGAVSYSVATNTGSASRQATLTIAGQTLTVSQDGQSISGTYDGLWVGKTGSNRAVAACVANNSIQSMKVSVRLDAVTWGCITDLVAWNPMPISGSSFSGTLSAYTEVSNAHTTLTGNFPTSTTMSGSWTSFSESWFLYCGSSLGFGTGGTLLSSGNFTASKQ